MVLSDAFEITEFEESDITEDLNHIKTDLNAFLSKIKTLEIDDESKLIYANVTHKLILSIEYYDIGGSEMLRENLSLFRCITKEEKEADSLFKKLSETLKKAKTVKETLGFFMDTKETIAGLLQ